MFNVVCHAVASPVWIKMSNANINDALMHIVIAIAKRLAARAYGYTYPLDQARAARARSSPPRGSRSSARSARLIHLSLRA